LISKDLKVSLHISLLGPNVPNLLGEIMKDLRIDFNLIINYGREFIGVTFSSLKSLGTLTSNHISWWRLGAHGDLKNLNT